MSRKKPRWKNRDWSQPIESADDFMDTNAFERDIITGVLNSARIIYGDSARHHGKRGHFTLRLLENLLTDEENER